jgi:hypothetical protein
VLGFALRQRVFEQNDGLKKRVASRKNRKRRGVVIRVITVHDVAQRVIKVCKKSNDVVVVVCIVCRVGGAIGT